MDRSKKIIYAIDGIILLGTILGIFFATGYVTPLVIAPQNDLVTTQTNVLFEFEHARQLLIDDNPDFTSPQVIDVIDDYGIVLEPGVYYWKVVGISSSDIRKFTIQSEVNLRLRKVEGSDSYEVTNTGNTPLHVGVYDHGAYVGDTILAVDERSHVRGTKVIGGEVDE